MWMQPAAFTYDLTVSSSKILGDEIPNNAPLVAITYFARTLKAF